MNERRIYRFEPWFFIFFGIFYLHRIWGIIDRKSYADFWIEVMSNRGPFYFIMMGILMLLCLTGIFVIFRDWGSNYWWRWSYVIAGVYVFVDLFAIVSGWSFWENIIVFMFNVKSSSWNLIWGGVILLGAVIFIFGIYLMSKGRTERLRKTDRSFK